MKLTKEMLLARTAEPLESTRYLDLSDQNIGSLGKKLSKCPNLETLILRGNQLQDCQGFFGMNLLQLWHLDLSNNELVTLDGLSNFLVFGSLVLSNNHLGWSHLPDLRHMHILSLSLHGNPALENDPYYRIHVIDSLPNLWMLDGRLITSSERILVRQFFEDSAMSHRPVRHKQMRTGFQTTLQRKMEAEGIFGTKAINMLMKLPKNAVMNVDTDWMRLHGLARDLEDYMNLEFNILEKDEKTFVPKATLLTDLFEARRREREKCNMILLLLVASLDFVLPTQLVRDLLQTARLTMIGKVQSMDLFFLPRNIRCKVVALMVSAVKVDREQNVDGALYTKLYLALLYIASELTRFNETIIEPVDFKLSEQMRDYKCLLATEMVQLMCIVPTFCKHLQKDTGVQSLVRIATFDPDIMDKIEQMTEEKKLVSDKDTSEFLLAKVQEQLQNLTNMSPIMTHCEQLLTRATALPMKGEMSPIFKADFLLKGLHTPSDDPPIVYPRVVSAKMRTKFPHLGDTMLLGPQTLGRVIGLPQPTYALVIIEGVPVATGAVEHKLKQSEQHYTYVDFDLFEWDSMYRVWKPKGTVGDKFTLQIEMDFAAEAKSGEGFRPGSPADGMRASTPLIYQQGQTPRNLLYSPEFDRQPRGASKSPQRPKSSAVKKSSKGKPPVNPGRRAKSAGSHRLSQADDGASFAVHFAASQPGMEVNLQALMTQGPSSSRSPPPPTSPDKPFNFKDTPRGLVGAARAWTMFLLPSFIPSFPPMQAWTY